MNDIRDRLEALGISCTVRTHSATNPGRHHGVPFASADSSYEYRIYVSNKDYKKAQEILG